MLKTRQSVTAGTKTLRMMRRTVNTKIIILITMIFSSMNIFGQKSYDNLWNDVSKARQERLPKTALVRVNEIIEKAEEAAEEQDTGFEGDR